MKYQLSRSESYFEKIRKNIVGIDQEYETPFGRKRIIYCDWIASGRLYAPIEHKISEVFGPFVANTHTETSETGSMMTYAYHHAQEIIKKHVNASRDVVFMSGTLRSKAQLSDTAFSSLLQASSIGRLNSEQAYHIIRRMITQFQILIFNFSFVIFPLFHFE